jgi:hypothetical protein
MTDTVARAQETEYPSGGRNSVNLETTIQFNKLVSDVDAMRVLLHRHVFGDGVVSLLTAGISVDATPADIEADNAIVIRKNGLYYVVAAAGAIDISALSAGGATIAQSKSGCAWVFANTAAGYDVEVPIDAAAYNSEIEAIAAWAVATNTLPPGADDVAVGLVVVTEGGSGAFTWGTDSITAETETYFDFSWHPGVESVAASMALDAAAATFTYGAGKVRLGSGTLVTYTGKANKTIAGTAVAHGAVGAWLVYILADDVEHAQQLGAAYASLTAAQNAVRDHNRNPLLGWIGTMYVQNNSGASFVPGTTNLDAAGITTTFVIRGTPASYMDSAADLTAAQVARLDGVVIQ